MKKRNWTKDDCPGEPGFECSDTPHAKGLCKRCYHRTLYRSNLEQRQKARERARRQYETDKASKLEYQRRYREKHKETAAEYNRHYRKKHRDKLLKQKRQHARDNPEQYAERNRQRRVRKYNAEGSHSEQEWLTVLDLYNGLCAYCSEPATTRDHVIPLNRGGTDSIDNIAPACRSCNTSKKDRFLWEWLDA